MKWRFDDILTFMSVMEAGSVTSGAARLKMSKIGDQQTHQRSRSGVAC